jgi:transposase InsO family protein
MLVIDHHTHYMWVRFLKSKDDTCSKLETIQLEIRHLHARHHSQSSDFASDVLKFDSDSVFEATATRQMCARMGVGVHFSPPYADHMLGKAERPWCTIKDNAFAMLHCMDVPNSMWSCDVSTIAYLSTGGVPLTLLTSSAPDTSKFRVF